jgi:hypothetical protein
MQVLVVPASVLGLVVLEWVLERVQVWGSALVLGLVVLVWGLAWDPSLGQRLSHRNKSANHSL